MIKLIKKVPSDTKEQARLTLPLSERVKSRLRTTLDDGRGAGLFLERGQTLKDGDVLASEDGFVVRVIAAREKISKAECGEILLMARACYHLGNRHVPLQISADYICYLHDQVLDDMLQGLGLSVAVATAPFEPEPGAYRGHGH